MNSETLKQLSSEWWFLRRSTFAEFANNLTAQGYEVIRRHPGFQLWGGSDAFTGRPWLTLTENQRAHFAFHFAADLELMGFHVKVWASEKAITFDCTHSPEVILRAIESELAKLEIAPESNDWGRTRISPRRRNGPESLIKFVVGTVNPDMVTILIEDLLSALNSLTTTDGEQQLWQLADLLGALNTFLKHDRAYQAHRRIRAEDGVRQAGAINRIRAASKVAAMRPEFPSIKRRIDLKPPASFEVRPKRPAPINVAMACMAADCARAAVNKIALSRPPIREKIESILREDADERPSGTLTIPDVRNCARLLAGLHDRVRLPRGRT
ncbi:MAG TPA: hypothetical protein VF773_02265 [Verrucomicrobiae bacterium]